MSVQWETGEITRPTTYAYTRIQAICFDMISNIKTQFNIFLKTKENYCGKMLRSKLIKFTSQKNKICKFYGLHIS